MKNKSIISLVLLLMGVGFMTTSCEDMLTPDLERYAEKSGQDTLYSYWGIMKSMQNIAERYVILGESRGDLVASGIYTNDSIGRLYNFENPEDGESAFLAVADYYKVINGCNFYLANADTASLKDNVYYMRKEYAQVQAMRAWTYLQLVQNYGSVPFVTAPISSTDEGLRLEKEAPRATASNLVTLLREAGLDRAQEWLDEYGYPSYLTYNNGSTSIASASCMYSVPLVLADLYLLAGDYESAATAYYKYLRDEGAKIPNAQASWSENETRDGNKTYQLSASTWRTRFKNYTKGTNYDLITLIPGAANSFFGTTLTSVQNVFGFKTSSSNSTSSNKDEDETTSDEEEITKSGSISVSADVSYLQLIPSDYYIGLNQEQKYCNYATATSGSGIIEYYSAGDTRLDATAPRRRQTVDNTVVTNRFIQKSCMATGNLFQNNINYGSTPSIYYGVQVYRKTLVALRFAEAINRAGFPQYAFAVLKDGLSSENLPSLAYKDTLRYNIDEAGDTLSIDTVTNVPYTISPASTTGGASYITVDEVERAANKSYMNFSDAAFDQEDVYGIHAFGCGDTRGDHDTVYTFDKAVAAKLIASVAEAQGWDERTIASEEGKLARKGVMNAVADGEYTLEQVIGAVEDLIIDELALETAFEGNRYPDLLRFAAHKGNGTIDNEWLAKKIARRGYAPSQSGYDASLYSKLVTGNYWYLSLPND